MTFSLYRIVCSFNGKSYIGRTIDAARRRRDHFRALHAGTHCNTHLQAAFRMHGADAFRWEVMCECDTLTELVALEQYFFDRLWRLRMLFNVSSDASGGNGKGRTRSAETRARMSASRKVYLSDPAVRAALSEKHRGKVLSAEHRAKLSAAHKGKTLTPEHRAAMSAAQVRRHAALRAAA